MAQLSVLIASEDSEFRSASARIVRSSGVSVDVTDEPPSADAGVAPDIVLVDGRDSGAGWQKVQELRSRWPAATIVAVASEHAPDRILEAMRAGANEFFFWPSGNDGPPSPCLTSPFNWRPQRDSTRRCAHPRCALVPR